MIKTTFYNKVADCNYKELFKKKGYVYFDKGAYNLNIIGIRSNTNRKLTNLFDDYLVLIYNTENDIVQKRIFTITTDPGAHYMRNPLSPKGTAILVPGQYRGAWKIGKHNGKYEALVQCKPVKVYRDNNKNDIYDLDAETIDNGIFGINIHRASNYTVSKTIDKYSAGCQVFANPIEFQSFMRVCKLQAAKYGNSFTYTLLTEDDLI